MEVRQVPIRTTTIFTVMAMTLRSENETSAIAPKLAATLVVDARRSAMNASPPATIANEEDSLVAAMAPSNQEPAKLLARLVRSCHFTRSNMSIRLLHRGPSSLR